MVNDFAFSLFGYFVRICSKCLLILLKQFLQYSLSSSESGEFFGGRIFGTVKQILCDPPPLMVKLFMLFAKILTLGTSE